MPYSETKNMPRKPRPAPGKHQKKLKNRAAWLTLALLTACGVIGFNRSQVDLTPYFTQLYPQAAHYKSSRQGAFAIENDSGIEVGYITTSTSNGFGGPMKVAVSVDTVGQLIGIEVIEHRETSSWYQRIQNSKLRDQLLSKGYQDPMALGLDIDGITGATYTARAITKAVKEATLEIAEVELGYDTSPYLPQKRLKLGLPEISLALLFVIATVGITKVPGRHKKTLKWLIMILGMIFVGFVYNHPLTLVDVNKLIMGYWPGVYNQLYWYLLIFGIILIFLVSGKNTYCRYICPFGAAQECVGLIGKARSLKPGSLTRVFSWTRRIVVLLAIMLALVYRNPSMSSYEVYGTLFNLLGTNFEVFFLGFVLLTALFIKRPWCNYLCPIPVIERYARFIHQKLVQLFKPRSSKEKQRVMASTEYSYNGKE